MLGQTCQLPGQPVDFRPLRNYGLVQVFDHLILMGDADFECVEAGSIDHAGLLARRA